MTRLDEIRARHAAAQQEWHIRPYDENARFLESAHEDITYLLGRVEALEVVRQAAQLRNNMNFRYDDVKSLWIAVPAEDFERLMAALAAAEGDR